MHNLSYNPEKDLVAIGQAVNTPSVIVVSAKSPFNTLADLVTYAKAHPGKLNFASAGIGPLSTRSPCRWFEALMNYTLDYAPVCATSWATEGLGPAMYVTP